MYAAASVAAVPVSHRRSARPKLLRFDAVELARAPQQIERATGSDEARQQPADAVLGDQTALREGRGELGRFFDEAHVAQQREAEAEAGARAVDRCDQRLADRQQIRIRHLEVVAHRRIARICVERAEVVFGAAAAGRHAVQRVHVHAGAEPAPRTGEYDAHDFFVAFGLLERVADLREHPRGEGVQVVGSVHRDGRHRRIDRIQDVLIHEFSPGMSARSVANSRVTGEPCWSDGGFRPRVFL